MKDKPSIFVRRADGNATVRFSKLHRIVHQVPKNLLQADGVGPDMMAIRAEVHDQVQLLLNDIVAHDFETVTNKIVGIDHLKMKLDFSTSNAGEIEQIVD